MKLNEDKSIASLDVHANLCAADLEAFICELLVLRANMTPPVPYEPPNAADSATETAQVSVQNDPYMRLGKRRNGGLRVWLRHQGLGWMVYDIPPQKTTAIIDYLNSIPRDQQTVPGLFGQEIDDTGRPH